MVVEISPVPPEDRGGAELTFSLPPDKSILHRLLFIGSLTQSAFTIPIPSQQAISHDIVATVLALESLGVPVELFPDRVELQGVGRHGYRMPTHLINCANSGTTARLLMGLLAGQRFNSALTGDESLSRRPMKRLADQLSKMGALLVTAPEGTLPLMINGREIKGAEVVLPVASAQMKSALLLAGLHASSATIVAEPWQSRDHTERMLESFGFGLEVGEDGIRIDPEIAPKLADEIVYQVPSDISSAAFLAVAAVLLQKTIVLSGVLLNPTRTRFLDILTLMGVETVATDVVDSWGESSGDLTIFGNKAGRLEPFHIEADDVPLLIDELPILSVLAAFADGESTIRGAQELRNKESDRLMLIASQLRRFGVSTEEAEDGVTIFGIPDRTLAACEISHHDDHRIAMSFSIASLRADGPVTVSDAEAVNISYPEFYTHLSQLAGRERVRLVRSESGA